MKTLSKLLVIAAVGFAPPAQSSDTQKLEIKSTRLTKTFTRVDSSRVMVLKGKVEDYNMNALVSQVKNFSNNPKKPAYLTINSPGGSVRAGLRLIYAIRGAKEETGLKVTCVIEEAAYSMAAVIAMFCHDTYVLPGADLMFHGASYSIRGAAADVEKYVAFSKKWLREVETHLATQLGTTYETFVKIRGRELWLTAEDAVGLGFVNGFTPYFFHTAEAPASPEKGLFSIFGYDINYITETNNE